ncbi:MAG: MFS transporter [Crocinitomicaceae bacterium]
MIQKGDKKIWRAWTFYDWANSVYPLVISTAIFPVFYSQKTSIVNKETCEIITDKVSFLGAEISNTVLYSWVVAASFIAVIILSPILSGVADYSGSKKKFLKFFCYLGAISTATLFFFNPERLELSMLSLFFASLGFWNSLVFYNAYLPEIAEPKDHDKLSAKGFSMGYIGSVILLVTCLVLIMVFKVPATYCFVLTGIWWIGFAQITYRSLPNPTSSNKITRKILGDGFRELKKAWKFIRSTVRLKRYLLAFFLLSMGVQTVMLMAVLFAEKVVFKCGDSAGLIIAVLLIQLVAVLGAFLFSRSSKKFGNIKTLGGALVIWVACCAGAYRIVDTQIEFYVLAGVVGLVMGGTQALSRSTYSKFLPDTTETASFFSFYDITEKIGIVIGMIIFGASEIIFGDIRSSVLSLVIFFGLGIIALMFVPKHENDTIPQSDQH